MPDLSAPRNDVNGSTLAPSAPTFWEMVYPSAISAALNNFAVPTPPASFQTAGPGPQEPFVAPHGGLEEVLRSVRGDTTAKQYWANLLAFAVVTALVTIIAMFVPVHF